MFLKFVFTFTYTYVEFIIIIHIFDEHDLADPKKLGDKAKETFKKKKLL